MGPRERQGDGGPTYLWSCPAYSLLGTPFSVVGPPVTGLAFSSVRRTLEVLLVGQS